MRFGDIHKFALDVEPVLPSWDRRTPSDRGPWARLTIWAAQENLCRNWMTSTAAVTEGVYVPLAPVADWFVRNAPAIAYQESAPEFPTDVDLPRALEQWKSAAPAKNFDEDSWDDRRFDWSERHFLLAGSDGSWLPNLAFVRVDDSLWISTAAAQFATPAAPSFVYKLGLTHRVPWLEARSVISSFVDEIGSSLRNAGLVEHFPWCTQCHPFERALEIGIQDYLRLTRGISEPEQLFGVGSIDELLAMLSLEPSASPEESASLQALRDLEGDAGVVKSVVDCDLETRSARSGRFLRSRSLAIEAAPGFSPEEQGQTAARLLRNLCGLDERPLVRHQDLLDQIEIEEMSLDLSTSRDHSVASGHADGFGKVILFNSPQTKKPWARRMELFRGVGHLLLDAGLDRRAVGAGSSTRSVGPRRRRSGAFAAELLLPHDAIRLRSGGVLDEAAKPEIFVPLMSDYQVGAQTAAWQCFNAGLLSSREVVQELIASYGSA
jgi:hypothetical protein